MGPVVERKALTALRQEGLVRARPRVGTVVASPGPVPLGPGAAWPPSPTTS
ncbi:MAG TPA: hypothetical protein VGP70_01645 [Actinomadura sp.]|jgi:DNA-binding GntR family transcriptional regulator|nr:hypothetical protein [Actinomadura sp.]